MSSLVNVGDKKELQTVSEEQLELIKRTVAKGATDDELSMFMHLAKKYDLDPFSKEIWFIKRVKKIKVGNDWDYPRLPNGEIDYSNCDAPVMMTSRDGYLKIAQRDENYEGLQSFVVREGDEFSIDAVNNTFNHKFNGTKRGKILGAWAICKRKGRDPQLAFIEFDEYNDSNSPIWKKYPSAMIQKVAEVFVLKRQFGISGLTTQEEMPETYNVKNVTEENGDHTEKILNHSQVPQIPERVGDFVVRVKGVNTKLSDMTTAQLEWLKDKSTNETTRAMASVYLDELEFNNKQIDVDGTIVDNQDAAHCQHVEVTNDHDPEALFGGTEL